MATHPQNNEYVRKWRKLNREKYLEYDRKNLLKYYYYKKRKEKNLLKYYYYKKGVKELMTIDPTLFYENFRKTFIKQTNINSCNILKYF